MDTKTCKMTTKRRKLAAWRQGDAKLLKRDQETTPQMDAKLTQRDAKHKLFSPGICCLYKTSNCAEKPPNLAALVFVSNDKKSKLPAGQVLKHAFYK